MPYKTQLQQVSSAVETVHSQIASMAVLEQTQLGCDGQQALEQRVAAWRAQLSGVHGTLGTLAHGRCTPAPARHALTGAYRSLVEAARYPQASGFCGFFHQRYDQITADLRKAQVYA